MWIETADLQLLCSFQLEENRTEDTKLRFIESGWLQSLEPDRSFVSPLIM